MSKTTRAFPSGGFPHLAQKTTGRPPHESVTAASPRHGRRGFDDHAVEPVRRVAGPHAGGGPLIAARRAEQLGQALVSSSSIFWRTVSRRPSSQRDSNSARALVGAAGARRAAGRTDPIGPICATAGPAGSQR